MSNIPNHDLYAPQWVSDAQRPKDLYSEILPGLYMGGTMDGDTVNNPLRLADLETPQFFDSVVTLYSWAHPMGWGVEEVRYGFGDADMSGVDVARILRIAKWAKDQWSQGQTVLIRCQAGLNRSGLLTALTLMHAGHTAEEAIKLIRSKRAEIALCNDDFVDWLITEAEAHFVQETSSSAA